jgi:ribosome-associated translation inhibitor RaiA
MIFARGVDSQAEAFRVLVPRPDFKSGGNRGDTASAGSIPVRFRHTTNGGAMTQVPAVEIRFKDVQPDDKLREKVERRCQALSEDFPETMHIEITFSPEGDAFTAHGHVRGKRTEAATSATADELWPASDRLFERLTKQLRRAHDKRIFVQRRDAQQKSPKKSTL